MQKWEDKGVGEVDRSLQMVGEGDTVSALP